MNCCNQNDGLNDNKGRKPKKHMPHWFHMILCCGIPMVLVFLLPYIGKLIPGSSGFLASVIPFICPVMMGFMMFAMFKGNKEEKAVNTSSKTNDESKSISLRG